MRYIDNEATVKMVQISRYNWQIQTSKGFVLQDDLFFPNQHQAEDYIKAYISSFMCWSYKVVPLEKKETK